MKAQDNNSIKKPYSNSNSHYHMSGNVICYFWKHKIAYNDNGCDVCGRCGRHEYYDNDFHNGKPFFKLYFWIRHKFLLFKSWYKIKFFNELPF